MKTIALKIPVFILAGMMMVGCKKAKTKEVSQKWTVFDYNEFEEFQNNNGTYYAHESIFSEYTFKINYISEPGGAASTAYEGIVNLHTLTFLADGTWKLDLEFEFEEENGMGSIDEFEIKTTQSGSWNFLDGHGDFRKNERIVLNTLFTRSETLATQFDFDIWDMTTTLQTDTVTYLDGELNEVYVIDDVTDKAMILTREGKTGEEYTSIFSGEIYKSTEVNNKTYKLIK